MRLFIFILFVSLTIPNTVWARMEDPFITISTAIKSIFAYELSSHNAQLVFKLIEAKKYPNAMARKKSETDWEIEMDQSMLELTSNNLATLVMILCHETGHFIGGQPYVVGRQLTPAVMSRAPKKMSCEGQADYFAAAQCFHRVIKEMPQLLDILPESRDLGLSQKCDESYQSEVDRRVCRIGIRASAELTEIYQHTLARMDMPQIFLHRFSSEMTDRTLNYVGEYPSLDCRFQTMSHGVLCNELRGGECLDSQWMRPACWFLP